VSGEKRRRLVSALRRLAWSIPTADEGANVWVSKKRADSALFAADALDDLRDAYEEAGDNEELREDLATVATGLRELAGWEVTPEPLRSALLAANREPQELLGHLAAAGRARAKGQGQESGMREMLDRLDAWSKCARESDGAAACTAHRVLDVLDAFLAEERTQLAAAPSLDSAEVTDLTLARAGREAVRVLGEPLDDLANDPGRRLLARSVLHLLRVAPGDTALAELTARLRSAGVAP
jgi:hypothetical protein